MTAVVWKQGLLLVDSYVEKGGEWMQVSDKVMNQDDLATVSHASASTATTATSKSSKFPVSADKGPQDRGW